MKRLTIISLLMSIALTSSAQKSLWKSRISFGVEWGYVATFNSGYHYNFFAPEGFRVNPSGNSFTFISNAETYLHIGYDITDDWNISLYAGYAGIADFHHAVPVSIRGTRFFERNSEFTIGKVGDVHVTQFATQALADFFCQVSRICSREYFVRSCSAHFIILIE